MKYRVVIEKIVDTEKSDDMLYMRKIIDQEKALLPLGGDAQITVYRMVEDGYEGAYMRDTT